MRIILDVAPCAVYCSAIDDNEDMSESQVPEPIIVHLPYGEHDRSDFKRALQARAARSIEEGDSDSRLSLVDDAHIMLNYPTVYIVHHRNGLSQSRFVGNPIGPGKYIVYVGETNDIEGRTNQHLCEDPARREDWAALARLFKKEPDRVQQYVIGDYHFNKSLTLDVENRLLTYLSAVPGVDYILNRRGNAQRSYYTADELDDIFSKMWNQLHIQDPVLFPDEGSIVKSALFKASPFLKLTDEQEEVERNILDILVPLLAQVPVDQDEDAGAAAPQNSIRQDGRTTVIVVQGMSGTGKTVLLSHIYYRICNDLGIYGYQTDETGEVLHDSGGHHDLRRSYIIVKQSEQKKVYDQIVSKLGLQKHYDQSVVSPVEFINRLSRQTRRRDGSFSGRGDARQPLAHKADVALIDEAHLLLTRRSRSYSGMNQLDDILQRSKMAIVIFDPEQVMTSAQQVGDDELALLGLPSPDSQRQGLNETNHLEASAAFRAHENVCFRGKTYDVHRVRLTRQMRVQASDATCDWLDEVTRKGGGEIGPLQPDTGRKDRFGRRVSDPYDIRVFDSPSSLFQAIRDRDREWRTGEGTSGLSRVLATYDWPYSQAMGPDDDPEAHWNVDLVMKEDGSWVVPSVPDPRAPMTDSPERFSHPWNYELYRSHGQNAEEKGGDAWAERPFTLDEVGSTYTIQGFDLNFAGVIIGPSVTYRDGQLVFNPDKSCNRAAIEHRSDMTINPADNLRHELNVLLKRGVHGLYLFAVDSQLQRHLREAICASERT